MYLVVLSVLVAVVEGGLTAHFQQWLGKPLNGYTSYDFNRDELGPGGSHGGKSGDTHITTKQPVVFVHGNGDVAMGATPHVDTQTGFSATRAYFESQGYTSADLYATTWGTGSMSTAAATGTYHSHQNVMHVRAFLEAVLSYTGAAQVDIISHSMGVTLSRKAIKGGGARDLLADPVDYDVGLPLSERVHTFVGISGANYGLATCYALCSTVRTCGSTNGFCPGYYSFFGWVTGRSSFLNDLLSEEGYEGTRRYTIWSDGDSILGSSNMVYGKRTSEIPRQTNALRLQGLDHFESKDNTAEAQYTLATAETPDLW